MHKVKTELSRLVRDVLNGKRVRVARRGQPVIELLPVVEDPIIRVPGLLKGKIHIAEDFDDPSDFLAAGRSLTFVEPEDRLPMSLSRDRGKTWEYFDSELEPMPNRQGILPQPRHRIMSFIFSQVVCTTGLILDG